MTFKCTLKEFGMTLKRHLHDLEDGFRMILILPPNGTQMGLK
jgi:hypothetical protein